MTHFPPILALFGGVGAPEMMIVAVILLVFLGRGAMAVGGIWRDGDRRLNRQETHILLFVGGVVALGIGLLVAQQMAR